MLRKALFSLPVLCALVGYAQADCGSCGGAMVSGEVTGGAAINGGGAGTVTRTVMVPEYVMETRTRNVTRYRQEQRTRTVNVVRMVPETREIQETYTVLVPQQRTRTETYTVRVPVREEVPVTYTVRVPQTETRTAHRTVRRVVTEQVMRQVTVRSGRWENRTYQVAGVDACGCPTCHTCCPSRVGSLLRDAGSPLLCASRGVRAGALYLLCDDLSLRGADPDLLPGFVSLRNAYAGSVLHRLLS